MRLRYVHLVRTPPLEDLAFVFGQETLLYGPDAIVPEKRIGAINFVVGVNGSGKSTLLRVIYQVFRALKSRSHPPLQIRLAWEIGAQRQGVQTAVLDYGSENRNNACFVLLPGKIPDAWNDTKWRRFFETLPNDARVSARGGDVPGHGALQQALPRRLLAYTSGAETLWDELEESEFHDVDTLTSEPQESKKLRPKGWSPARERNQGGFARSQQAFVNEGAEEDFGFLRRVSQSQLRLAAITLGIFESSSELNSIETMQGLQAYRQELLLGHPALGLFDSARRLLNYIDWFRCTHLSLVYSLPDELPDDLLTRRRLAQLYCLLALAEERGVIAEAMERRRIVVPLGPAGFGIFLSERLEGKLDEQTPREIANLVSNVDGAKNGAEAVLRVFSEAAASSLGMAQMFDALCDWQASGWLHEITLVIERTHLRDSSSNNEGAIGGEDSRASFVTFDQLSDGEQMLVGRIALMFLLQYQDQSLLLLDEPETHFNDVWKREIIDWIDDALLKDTNMQVLVATHTSIALTDAFAAEVTVLTKSNGITAAQRVGGGLFGTDPGEVSMNLFGAEGSTGSRAARILESLLKTDWKGREVELERVLTVLGSSFHRAELRAILKQLKASPDGSA
jgi:ABC-type molybdenum transport system ATPase subunit/photorepair protein PhrA